MSRYIAWLANTLLYILCCFLVADTANAIFSALLTPVAAAPDVQAAAPPPSRGSWSERQQIVARNLFNASILAPAAPVRQEVEPEELEATRLPLKLVGTAAAANPADSWAAIQDLEKRKTAIVRVGGEVRPTVPVLRIERRRIVLSENGTARELVLSEDGKDLKLASTDSRSRRSASRRAPRQSRRAARTPEPEVERELEQFAAQIEEEEGFQTLPRADIEEALRNPAAIFQQARIQPQLDEAGEMQGLQINDIKPGSLFEQAGIQNGDVITQVNGIAIDSPEKSPQVMGELSQPPWTLTIVGPDGVPRESTVGPDS